MNSLEHVRPSPEVAAVADEVVATRRDLNAHPELGYQERRTARWFLEQSA